MNRVLPAATVLWGLVISLFCLSSGAAQDATWHYLSNDGDPTLLVKNPSYFSVPDKNQHIGIVPFKTEVEVLSKRSDKDLPSLEWKQVRILYGQFKGQTGWVSGNCVVTTSEARPRRPQPPISPAPSAKKSARLLPDGGPRITGIVATATQLRDRPDVFDTSADAPKITPETLLERLSNKEHIQDAGLDVSWIHVRVMDGPHKDKEGWVLRHHVRELRRLLYFAIWYKVQDRAFERAAQTALDEFEATLVPAAKNRSSDKDDMDYVRMSVGIRTKSEFLEAWKQVKNRADTENLEVYYGALLTHASIQSDARDGLEFGPEEADGTLRPGEISRLERLPWSSDAKGLYLHGCYTGAIAGWFAERNWCPAQLLAKHQRITTWGQVGTATFSSDATKYVAIEGSDSKVYLYSFNRGKNKPGGDGTRLREKEFHP